MHQAKDLDQEGRAMSVLVNVFLLAGNLVVHILGIAEPDMKDPFWRPL